ncbi:glycoside hydrolase family 88 protein [Aspergillus mulundensis]|uniref:Glucuronyl hydrolase n=1 Tax=Aspergillus mulundensis TaxID=1810919 RepID=A0A3D8T504_9EURO|nr:hypothetical protein DSM5745_00958 [Aspergillus mulundensis]RDW93636.1 hypothetical protein DSM5745_00958 [Aspergillus mulundensis]
MPPTQASSHEQALIQELFAENVIAKVLRVAEEALQNNSPPTVYPEFVPQHGPDSGRYFLRDANFWTCGFFPGILYLLRERAVKYPQAFPYLGHECQIKAGTNASFLQQLTTLCTTWTGPIKDMATRTDTHDIGFILTPSFRRDWELTSNRESLDILLTGARSLASRFVPSVGAIRSWDALRQANVDITSLDDDCLVIVDSMMNLDLLYYASAHSGTPKLSDIATTHARTVMKALLRRESLPETHGSGFEGQLYSTYHVVNFSPRTGEIKEHRTAQGYHRDSTWARGQAWAIYGFAQTYAWTKDREFLDAAIGLAEYFIHRLETSPDCVERPSPDRAGAKIGRYVPLWDFDAPIEKDNPLRDSSAGVIAANGMLLLSQALAGPLIGDAGLAGRYRGYAFRIVTDTIEFSLARERARLVQGDGESASGDAQVQVQDAVAGQRFDAILKNATANHNAQDHDRYSDHGLVYGDYYLLEFGNQLLRMRLV